MTSGLPFAPSVPRERRRSSALAISKRVTPRHVLDVARQYQHRERGVRLAPWAAKGLLGQVPPDPGLPEAGGGTAGPRPAGARAARGGAGRLD